MSNNKRLRKLRDKLQEQDLDSMLISTPENRRYLSGFTGSAGYNTYFGSYGLDPRHRGKISISDIVQTEMYCEGLMDQETEYLTTLAAPDQRYLVKDNRLTLTDGLRLLTFNPR